MDLPEKKQIRSFAIHSALVLNLKDHIDKLEVKMAECKDPDMKQLLLADLLLSEQQLKSMLSIEYADDGINSSMKTFPSDSGAV